MSTYEVFAIRYARHERPATENFIGRPIPDMHDGPMPVDYFVWLIRGAGRTIVVDTGFGEAAARQRGRTLLIHPVEALRRFGVAPETVDEVVVTHLHFDHAGNIDAFPRARFHIQDSEMAYATGRCMCHGFLQHPFDVDNVVAMVRHLYAGRAIFHDGDAEIGAGLSLLHLPGHSKGLQGIGVATRRGRVILASDASHYYANLETGNPFPIVVDVAGMLESHKRLLDLAGSTDHIVPGHDPLVRDLYPVVACPGVEVRALHEKPRPVPRAGAA